MSKTPEIIFDAYRESNSISAKTVLTDWQESEALTHLNRIVSGAYGYEVGEQLFDWPIGQYGVATEDQAWWGADSWGWPPANARLIAASEEPQTVRFLPQPSDGARMMLIDPNSLLASHPITLDANGRTIEGSQTLEISEDGIYRTWLYRADLGDWTRMSVLTGAADEEFPFPMEFDDYFVTKLAMRLNPRYGRSLSEESAVALDQTLNKLRARYQQSVTTVGDPGLGILTRGYNANWRGGARNMPVYQLRRHIRPPFGS